MMVTNRERAEWARRRKVVAAIDSLIGREDADNDLPALDNDDREALRVVLRIASESDTVFRQILRRRGSVRWNERVDYLCDSIRSGMDFFAIVKQTARTLEGIEPLQQRSERLRDLLTRHTRLFKRIQARDLGLSERLSIVLQLIQIELIFFGHFW
jgi:hypothetical protein